MHTYKSAVESCALGACQLLGFRNFVGETPQQNMERGIMKRVAFFSQHFPSDLLVNTPRDEENDPGQQLLQINEFVAPALTNLLISVTGQTHKQFCDDKS